jgi:hypothetical protein
MIVAMAAPEPDAAPAHPLVAKSTSAFEHAEAIDDPERKAELLQEAQRLAGQGALADAYAYLQKAVGLIAVTLPFVVIVGHLVSGGDGLQRSISAYYYTHMGTYFVGSLFALGVFFLSYNYKPLPDYEIDNWLSKFASLAAVVVALFPTSSDPDHASGGSAIVAGIHITFAMILFVLLAIFSLFLFTKTDDAEHMTSAKRHRNLVYRICGWTIVAAIAMIGISQVAHPPQSWHTFLWLESIAVVAFGISWLVKGGFLGLLTDP